MIIQSHKNTMTTIMRDMADGVIVIDRLGKIKYLNPAGEAILQKNADTLCETAYVDFLAEDERNEDFHQFVLDAIYDKEKSHNGVVSFQAGGQPKKLRVTSSFVFSEDKTELTGVSVVFSDVTEVEKLNTIRRESTVIFSILMSFIAMYIFIYSAIYTFIPDFRRGYMAIIGEIIATIAMVIILNTTSISVKDFNLRMKNPLRRMTPAIVIILVSAVLMVLVKAIILALGIPFFPENSPFIYIPPVTVWVVLYPFTAFIQEILARCIVQSSLKYVFTGKHAASLSIIVSSLAFGALHISHGMNYMIASFLLLAVMGIYYEKSDRNIWGTFLMHYILGVLADWLLFTMPAS
jgi:PAS domain S-box-containing protein